ncbi:MMPL family transporter [Rhizohabitans arisaemae]|uniref:MMPL family transporter n=1 Tax=Rhizohabitans arisaemae TaxID=2720610 RepID=UPI0024B0DFDC|nr:MMPL family transporter [Rhizohabitans arisaemae]
MKWITGRRSKWLVIVVWLLLALPIARLGADIRDIQQNNFAQFTPSSVDSTQVREILAARSGSQEMAGIVVYARESGLTDGDRAVVKRDHPGVETYPSDDGKAVVAVVPIDGTDESQAYDRLHSLREQVHRDVPDGLRVEVTGPAGFFVDSADAFLDADLTLLLVTLGAVAFFLLVIYRSPILWLLPLLVVGLSSVLSQGLVYLLAKHAGIVVTGMSSGILTALVFGAGTDYALLLISRYREELRGQADRHAAMATALRAAFPALAASAATVALGVLCLLVADVRSSASLGPVAAVGVLCAFLAMTTFLPALLLVFGRWVFWPLVPRPGQRERTGVWGRVGTLVGRKPRAVWVGTVLGLVVLTLGLTTAKIGIPGSEAYHQPPESIRGQHLISAHFPGGSTAPADVVTDAANADRVSKIAAATPGVARLLPAETLDGGVAHLRVILNDAPESDRAGETISRLRTAFEGIPGTRVGGITATQVDTAAAHRRDLTLVIPLALLVIFLVLVVLLRSLVAPLLLIVTVVLTFGAVLGAGWLLFDRVLGFPALGYDAILLGFVFLVALGVDYNIFMVGRIREETRRLGDPRTGVLRGLALTGSVITGAGLVLAATFSALTVLPLVWAVEFGVLVAFGVILDTFLVRSVLLPALMLDVGERFWWPSRKSRYGLEAGVEPVRAAEPA